MAKLWRVLTGRAGDEARYSFDDYLADSLVTYQGNAYALGGMASSSNREDIANSFGGYVGSAYRANGVVFATILSRLLLFSEARFQWQNISNGRPGDLFGTSELSILERPWPNGTTGELLARMEQDVSLAGNFYCVREGDRLRRLRPDWVSIILTAPAGEAVQSDVAGYMYRPGGELSKAEPAFYLPEEMCHWSPIPDPEAQYRGMSWLSPVLREVQADKKATLHKERFFDNGATLGPVVSVKESVTADQFKEFIELTNRAHEGADNAYRTMYVGGGADVSMRTADFRQLDFRSTQGAGETRITAAGGVPAVIVGLSEGLQAATYSNYGQARRKFGDHWARPQWRSACAALSSIVRPPSGASSGAVRLWYDDRDIAFLREDQRDAAEIVKTQLLAMEAGVRAGYVPETVTAAVTSGDLSALKHTGLVSVQLLPPGTTGDMPPATNGDNSNGGGDK